MMSVCIITGLRKSEEVLKKLLNCFFFRSIELFYNLTIELLTYLFNNWIIYVNKCGIIISSVLKNVYCL